VTAPAVIVLADGPLTALITRCAWCAWRVRYSRHQIHLEHHRRLVFGTRRRAERKAWDGLRRLAERRTL
jgi:hypothetical protein